MLDFFENKYFFAILSILTALYGAQIRPTLPKIIMDLFQNPMFRLLILFLILVRGYKDPQFALIMAVSFILIMDAIRNQLFKETFSNYIPNQTCAETILNKNIINHCINNLEDNSFKENNKSKLYTKYGVEMTNLKNLCAQVNISDLSIPAIPSSIDCKSRYNLE